MPPLQGEWLEALKPEFGKQYYKQLFAKVGQEYQTRRYSRTGRYFAMHFIVPP